MTDDEPLTSEYVEIATAGPCYVYDYTLNAFILEDAP